jgi:23S rRNA (cytidine1920-2'-O)/16S rRNA (cytidine1409-2'-O)-methyltransferase
MRLDQWLVKHQKVRSRTQAEELIKRGEVFILNEKTSEWQKVLKPSFDLDNNFNPDNLKIDSVLMGYVARSGYKLEKALEVISSMYLSSKTTDLNLQNANQKDSNTTYFNIKGLKCLDVGQSTGGFSQALLEAGADLVVGLDVGTGQLSPELKGHSKLISFENLDIRKAKDNEDFVSYSPFDLAVVDVSFISLTQVLDSILQFIKPEGQVLALVKPQFELTSKDLDKKGRVKSEAKYQEVQTKITDYVLEHGLKVEAYFVSQLEGKDGNTEFFIYLKNSNDYK